MSSRAARPRALLALWAAIRARRSPGAPSASAALRTLPRLLAATASGQYSGTPPRQLALMAGAAVYLVSPIDLVPELALLGAGLLDDGLVLAWLAGAVLSETEAFLAWEREQQGRGARRAQEARQRDRAGRCGGDDPDLVVGEVVP